MVKLPDKSALGGPPSMAEFGMTSLPTIQGGGGEGEILGALAGGVKKLSGTIQAKVEEADDYEVQKRLIDFDLEQEKRLDDAKRNAAPEAKNFTQSYRGEYDAGATRFMENVPARLRPKLDEILVKRGASFEKRAYDFELAERDRYHIQDVNQQTSDAITRTMGNPDTMEDNAERGRALIRNSKLSARAKMETERKFLDMNAEYGLKSLIDREIEAGRDAGTIIERLRKVQRGSMAPPQTEVEKLASKSFDEAGEIEFAPVPLERRIGKPRKAAVKGVVVHYTEGSDTIEGNASWSNKTNTGAHYYIGKDGKVFMWADDSVNMPHAGVGRSGVRPDLQNDTTIGIEIMTRKGEEPNEVQIAAARRLIAAKGKEHGFTKDDVFGHGELTPGHRKSTEGMAVVSLVRRGNDGEPVLVDGPKRVTAADRVASAAPESVPMTQRGLTTFAGLGGGKTATDASPDTAPVGAVERTTLPDIAKGEDNKVKIDPETGKPVLSTDIADTKSDMPGAPKPGEATTQSDEPEESDEVPYPHLLPQTRRKLINYARTAGRAVVTKGVDDDIARIRIGRQPTPGPDGKTSLDRAKAHMTGMQWEKKRQEWKEAEMEYSAISPLREMTNQEAADHIAGLIDKAEGDAESIKAAARVQKKAQSQYDKMIKMRESDPVRSINGFDGDEPDDRRPPLPNVRAVMKTIAEDGKPETVTGPNGDRMEVGPAKKTLTPQRQWEMMFDARLADQETVMPDEPEKHRIITKDEASRLLKMPKDGKGLDDKDYRRRLEDAADRAERIYGPKYAKRVLDEAIGFHLQGGTQDQKAVQSRILRKIVTGEAVLSEDLRQMRDIDQLARSSLSVGMDSLVNMDRVGRSGPNVVPMGDAGRPAIAPGQGYAASPATPSPKQIEWLRSNPDGVAAFDEKFGAGSASRVLSVPVMGQSAKGVKPTESKDFDWSKRKTNWLGR